jgi:hypothetical protein
MFLVLAKIQPTVATTRCIGMGQFIFRFYCRLPKTIAKKTLQKILILHDKILIFVNIQLFWFPQQYFNLCQQ